MYYPSYMFLILSLSFSLVSLNVTTAAAGALADGGQRLVDLQADITADNAGNGLIDDDPDDGGWDWYNALTDTSHSSSPSPDNIYGPIANGLLEAFKSEGGIRMAIGLVDTYYGYDANPDIDSGADFGFLVRLSDLTGDLTYATLAKDRWDAKMAFYGGADSLAMGIRDSRHDQNWDALIPWDIGLFIESAMELQRIFPGQGYQSDAIDMADVVYGDITSDSAYFQMDNDSLPAYYLGLEGVLVSFGLTDVYTSYAIDAGRTLISAQLEDGSWPWNIEYPGPDDQTTAYVVMGFGMLDLSYPSVNNAAQAGSDYMASVQQANGGWDEGGYEYPEVNGECLRAIAYYPPTAGMINSDEGRMTNKRSSAPVALVHPWTD